MRRYLTTALVASVAVVGLAGCAAYVEPAPVAYYPGPAYCYYGPSVVYVHGGYYGGGYRRWR